MTKLIDFIHKTRGLSFVNRWNFHPHLTQQNVADHSFWVMFYSWMLCTLENYFESQERTLSNKYSLIEVLQYAMMHDIAESVIGDIPYLVKRETRKINIHGTDVIDRLDHHALIEIANTCFSAPLIKEFYSITRENVKQDVIELVKVADTLECLIYCLFEKEMGNHSFDTIIKETHLLLIKKKMKSVDLILEGLNIGTCPITDNISHL